jgi:hypothetical protein
MQVRAVIQSLEATIHDRRYGLAATPTAATADPAIVTARSRLPLHG